MAEQLHETTKVAILGAVLADADISELLGYYSPELTLQQRVELGLTIKRLAARAIEYTMLMGEMPPEDVMAAYNAGVTEGYREGEQVGEARGFEQGYLQAMSDIERQGVE